MSTYLKKRFPLLIIGVTVILFLANASYHIKKAGAVPVLTIINCDYYDQLLPWLTFAKQSILSGSFPLWTPYQALGHPFYAEDQIAVSYPLTWLLLLFDVPLGLFFIQLVTVAIAMGGMTLYMRYLEVDWPGAVLGSVLFAYPVYQNTFIITPGSTLCWLPLIILTGHRLLDKPDFRRITALVVVLSLSILGGFLQYFYYICMIVFIYFLLLMISSLSQYGYSGILLRTALMAVAVTLTVFAVSISLFPSLELSLASVRSFATDYREELSLFEFRFSALSAFKNYIARDSSNVYGLESHKLVFALYYLGSSLLVLPFAFFRQKSKRVAIVLFIALVYTTVFVLVKNTPAVARFPSFPFSDTFRWHGRMLDVNQFLIAALAGMGLSSFSERKIIDRVAIRKPRVIASLIFICACSLGFAFILVSPAIALAAHSPIYLLVFLPGILAVLMLLLYHSNYSPSFKWLAIGTMLSVSLLGLAGIMSVSPLDHVGTKDILLNISSLVISISVIVFLIACLAICSSWRGRFWSWGILALMLLEIGMIRNITCTVPATADIVNAPGFQQIAKPIEWIKENAPSDRVLLQPKGLIFMDLNIANIYRFYNINSYTSLTLARWNNFYLSQILGVERFMDFSFYGPVSASEMFLHPQFAGLLSLRYIVLSGNHKPDKEIEVPGWNRIYQSHQGPHFSVYMNDYSLLRAYVVSNYVLTNSEEESLKQIRTNISELSHSVILENGNPSFLPTGNPKQSGMAAISSYEGNQVILHVTAHEPSLVVLTDAYYPGWIAYVDGVNAPVWRANSLFRAVEVPVGDHTVVFKFRPRSLLWGALISGPTLIILLTGCLIEYHYRAN